MQLDAQVTLPLLGLAVTREPADDLLPLLGRLSRWCRPRLPDPALGPAVAVLATDPLADVPDGVPLAVLVRREQDLEVGCAPLAVRILTRDEAVLARAGSRAAWLPLVAQPPGVRHLPPWVRARVRTARGLPEQPVLLLRDGALVWQPTPQEPGQPVADVLTGTAMATAAAAALTGAAAASALAWGTPLVTDAATAAELGAVDGRDVLVVDGSDEERALASSRLAGDDRLAAALSLSGRRLAERRHDLSRTAAELARALLPVASAARGQVALDELDTPAGARVRARYDEAVAAVLPAADRRTVR